MSGDFLDVGAVGDDTGRSQSSFVQLVAGQDLLGVLAHRHIAVAHAEQDVLSLQVLGQRIEAVDALVGIFRDAQDDLIFQQIHAGIAVHEIQTLGVHLSGSGAVQLVHLLLTCRKEQVTVCALLDLGLQGAGGVKVEAEGHAGVLRRIGLGDGVQRLGQGRCSEDDQLDGLARSSLRRGGGRACHGGNGAAGAAAGGQGSRCGRDAGSAQEAAAGDLGIHGHFSLRCSHRVIVYSVSRRAGL